MNITEPTDRQMEILQFIREYFAGQQRAPTVREIMARFEIKSPNGVAGHLKALRAKGLIKTDERISRGVRMVSDHGFEVIRGRTIKVRIDRPLSHSEARRLSEDLVIAIEGGE